MLLFWLIFLPGVALPFDPQEMTGFVPTDELARILYYELPSMILVLYLLFRDHSPSDAGYSRPHLTDLFGAALVFAALAAASAGIGWIVDRLSPVVDAGAFPVPMTAWGWSLVVAGGIATGYLEESYFRVYLRARFDEIGANEPTIAVVSIILFAVCHLYEGVWGALNAVAAAAILFFAYRHWRSVHVLAWSHAAYNVFVYIIGAAA